MQPFFMPLSQPDLGKCLKAMRESRGLSLSAAGRKLGTSASYIANIENDSGGTKVGRERIQLLMKVYGYRLIAIPHTQESVS